MHYAADDSLRISEIKPQNSTGPKIYVGKK